jgi:hypothetical protein
MKLKLLLTIVFLTKLLAHAQTEVQDHVKIPLSPNATSLGQYGTIPVGLFSGTAQYSIPLYTVKGRNLEVPITLNYRSNGIPLEEISSWVGAGWSIDGGGVITRDVRDKYDGDPNPGSIPNLSVGCLDYSSGLILEDNNRDLEYDLFTFNFQGNSGSFIIQDGLVKLIEEDGMKITVDQSLNSFIITDNNGIKYFFGGNDNQGFAAIESTIIGDSGYQIKTAWYLTKILHWGGEYIDFTYSGGVFGSAYFFGFNQSRTKPSVYEDFCGICPYPNLENPWSPVSSVQRSKFRNNPVYLKSISCSNLYDYANFEVSSDQLQKIKGFNRTINFDLNVNQHRKYLKKIQFSSNGGALGEKYSFEYYDELEVPARNSVARDKWGFYNGAINNPNLLTGNHGSNSLYAKNGSLKKIIFPTGGYTLINYESNSRVLEGVCLSQTSLPLPDGEEPIWYFGGGGNSNEPEIAYYSYNLYYSFTVQEAQDVTFNLNQEYYPDPQPAINSYNNGSAKFFLAYPDNSQYEFPQPNFDNGSRQFTRHLAAGIYGFSVAVKSGIYRANFRINLCTQYGSSNLNFGGLRVKDTEDFALNGTIAKRTEYTYDSGSFAVPRLISHQYIDAQSTCIQSTGYGQDIVTPAYCILEVNNSTGILSPISSAGLAFYGIVEENIMDGEIKKSKVKHHFMANPFNALPSAAYGSCEPIENPSNYYFGSPYEYKTDYLAINNNNQEKIIKKIEYNYEYSTPYPDLKNYMKLKKKNGFSFHPSEFTNNCLAVPQRLESRFRLSIYSIRRFWKKLNSKVETDYFYDDQLTNLIEKVVNKNDYFYENFIHKQLTKEIKYLSSEFANQNEIETIKYFYPDDIIQNNSLYGHVLSQDQLNAISKMNTSQFHIINKIVQTEKINYNNLHMETSRLNYKLFSNSNNEYPLLENIETLKGEYDNTNNLFVKKIFFSNYNFYNLKAQQIFKLNFQQPLTIIYGYNNRYPIAVIKNQLFDNNIQNFINSYSNSWDYFQTDYETMFNVLNTGENQVSMYKYARNNGVSDIIDEKFHKKSFGYDIFNRLNKILDSEGNLIEEYIYHFKL